MSRKTPDIASTSISVRMTDEEIAALNVLRAREEVPHMADFVAEKLRESLGDDLPTEVARIREKRKEKASV